MQCWPKWRSNNINCFSDESVAFMRVCVCRCACVCWTTANKKSVAFSFCKMMSNLLSGDGLFFFTYRFLLALALLLQNDLGKRMSEIYEPRNSTSERTSGTIFPFNNSTFGHSRLMLSCLLADAFACVVILFFLVVFCCCLSLLMLFCDDTHAHVAKQSFSFYYIMVERIFLVSLRLISLLHG